MTTGGNNWWRPREELQSTQVQLCELYKVAVKCLSAVVSVAHVQLKSSPDDIFLPFNRLNPALLLVAVL